MKILAAGLALAVCASLPAVNAGAQNTTGAGSNSSAGEPTFITPAEFVRAVRAGTLFPITPAALAAQNRERRATTAESRRVVERFLRKHPELTDLEQLVRLKPDLKDPSVSRGVGGDFNLTFTDSLGDIDQVETLSQAFKLDNLAEAIRSESDRGAQFNLYSTLYNAIPPTFVVKATPPAQLRGATLIAIRSALSELVAALDPIARNIPLPVNPLLPVPTCEDDIGASTTPGINENHGPVGDQTRNVCPPSATGIIGNFTFPSRPYLTCVKSQGHRGTCHIFASVSAVEESVALQTGKHVNLSEQELMEFVRGLWDPEWYHDGGSPSEDLAASHGYHFAYERQWDYNPSPNRDNTTYQHSCQGYPSSETACSNSSPQAPIYCTEILSFRVCGFDVVHAAGAHSPYRPMGTSSIYYPDSPDLTTSMMEVGLALNIPVVMAFDVSDAFSNPTNGYVTYSTSDVATDGGGHVVHVVAYVSNDQLARAIPSAPAGAGGGYFVIKNSWGGCAGDAGFYYMPVKYFLARTHGVGFVNPVSF
jgi:hypothetical protein